MNDKPYFAHPTAVIDEPCEIGAGTKIWHFCHVMSGARIGERCVLGQNVFIGSDVVIGNNVKIQNNVSVYTGVELEDDVFCGPSCVFTNVSNPRSQIMCHHLYERTLVRRGATIGANATEGKNDCDGDPLVYESPRLTKEGGKWQRTGFGYGILPRWPNPRIQ